MKWVNRDCSIYSHRRDYGSRSKRLFDNWPKSRYFIASLYIHMIDMICTGQLVFVSNFTKRCLSNWNQEKRSCFVYSYRRGYRSQAICLFDNWQKCMYFNELLYTHMSRIISIRQPINVCKLTNGCRFKWNKKEQSSFVYSHKSSYGSHSIRSFDNWKKCRYISAFLNLYIWCVVVHTYVW